MLRYTARREIGRARSTSRVPRARSPATATAEAPTAKIPSMAMASGCCTPSVIAPGRLKKDPDPKFISSRGKAPELARSRITSLKAA
jgi:hypothetical protein